MNKKIEKQFNKHLKKICKNKEIRTFAENFYVDFCAQFEGQTFTKNNFETLNVNGKEIEQDVVKHVFKNKETATAEEIFVYLFKNNISSMGFFDRRDIRSQDPQTSGFVNVIDKKLKIKNHNLDKYYHPAKSISAASSLNINETKQERKLKEREQKKNQKEEIQRAKDKRLESLQHITYHELSHVFEIKSFENGKYVKNDLSNKTIVKKFAKNFLTTYTPNLTNENIKNAEKDNKVQNMNKENALNYIKRNGATAISEILNEEFTCNIDNSLMFCENYNSPHNKFAQKAKLEGSCSYNENIDISSLLKLAIGDFDNKDLRFNSKKIINQINNLNISKEKQTQCVEQCLNYCNSDNIFSDKDEALVEHISKTCQNADFYTVLTTTMGLTSIKMEQNYNSNEYNDYKLLIQDMLIEGIKNNLNEQLHDPTIKKDKAFFEKVNSTLKTIDSFVLYPNDDSRFKKPSSNPLNPDTIIERNIDICSVNQYAKNNPNLSHLQSFNEIINNVQQSVNEHESEIENLSESMTFLQEQASLDEKYSTLSNSTKEALTLQETTRKEQEAARLKQYEEWKKKHQESTILKNNDEEEKE